ncbi:hypothetical protein [Telmatospirillum sp. J64-1]|uniref:hypothetical protein n=1 Tax=Telmatospirillum sp. J64-1 TaxID=2502183 RepID=UPI00115EB17B|nr:hypothetical protein [Telmatospirillum sp. J64-1]
MPNLLAQFGDAVDVPVIGYTVCYRTPGGGTSNGAPMSLDMASTAVANFKEAYGPRARYWIAPYYEWRSLLRDLPQAEQGGEAA